MNDLISRQDAIDEFNKGMWGVEWDKALAKTMIESLPSAEPEIIRCKDCIYYHPSYCEIWSKYGTVQTREKGYCYMAERRE